MLEYFTYKKFKKNKAEKEQKNEEQKATSPGKQPENETKVISSPPAVSSPTPEEAATPLLTDDDERFLERLTTPADDDDNGPAPPLPPRVATPELTWDSDSESFIKPSPKPSVEDESKSAGKKPLNRLSSLFGRSKKDSEHQQQLVVPTNLAVPEPEVDREQADLARVLDDLNLSARNNTAFALSQESTELVRRFTLILKDLVNGVPTAVNDLTSLLDDPDGKLAKNYERLPKSLKKLVTQLPEKLSKTLAPELLAVAAEAQGLAGATTASSASKSGGLKGAAKRMFLPKNLAEMVTKPGAIVGMLRGIMNALKLRWPAFIGTNVIWSVALFCELLPFFPTFFPSGYRQYHLMSSEVERVLTSGASTQCCSSSSGIATSAAERSGWRKRTLRMRSMAATGSRSSPTTRLCLLRRRLATRSSSSLRVRRPAGRVYLWSLRRWRWEVNERFTGFEAEVVVDFTRMNGLHDHIPLYSFVRCKNGFMRTLNDSHGLLKARNEIGVMEGCLLRVVSHYFREVSMARNCLDQF